MASQWENLFQNAGTWNGVFTRLEPDGTVVSNTPSCLQLERTAANQCRFQLTRYPEGQPPQNHQTDFASLARTALFFNDGSFSKGSMQWSPVSEFGAEFGLTLPNARLRLVQMFKSGGDLSYLVLIPETREGEAEVVRPPLSVEQLMGTWRGEAIAYFTDWTQSDPMPTEYTIAPSSTGPITQTWRLGDESGQTQIQQQGDRLCFEESGISYQLLLLPKGGSSLCPQTIRHRVAFRCELAWLIDPQTRLRVIRHYGADGGWQHSTWVKETKCD
ncbi:MAG: DUF3598 family protein [Spirulina sp. SIO3F2]|nr:DUF3598 family protein [Spirulina sp. SIO3F2]